MVEFGLIAFFASIAGDRACHGLCLHVYWARTVNFSTSSIGDGPEAAEDFHLGVAHHVGIERVGRFHRDQTEQLKHMVLYHVAQAPRLLRSSWPGPDAFRFAHRDLHMVDILVVPDRLEDAVGEPHDHEILDRLFAQIMIDAENLRFVEHAPRDLR